MRPRLVLALLALALAAFPAGTAAADPSHSSPRAARALAQAEALFHRRPAARAYGRSTVVPAGHGRDATLLLRQLALRFRELDAADRRTARRILARPTDGAQDPVGFGYTATEATPYCSAHLCVHWVPTGSDAPAATDANANGVPDQVEITSTVFEQVWAAEVGTMGYRAPVSDGDAGGGDALDVYLVDSGKSGVYGYCTTDDPIPPAGGPLPGYCAVDNDFADFPGNPRPLLEVTAAHEFFHAVQFAYDAGEDLWFMESTAAWIEDEVYDDVNDNYQFLTAGPLGRPYVPLDYFAPDSNDVANYYPQYGGWILWKYLSETYGRGLVRQVWEKAASTYSLAALRSVLGDRGLDFTAVFARFGAVNRTPGRFYSEGASYPKTKLSGTFTLTARDPVVRPRRRTLYHLTTSYVRFRRGATLQGVHRLRVGVDMPDRYRGSAATLMVHRRDGHVELHPIALNRRGLGYRTVRFSRSEVASVELALTDASTRFTCGQGDYRMSCNGIAKDDALRSFFTAKAVR
jgi:hypothetical protein